MIVVIFCGLNSSKSRNLYCIRGNLKAESVLDVARAIFFKVIFVCWKKKNQYAFLFSVQDVSAALFLLVASVQVNVAFC